MTVDLTTEYMGLTLRSPLVASASPLTGSMEGLIRLEAAGAGAVVLPSLFEEQLAADAMYVDRTLSIGSDSFAETTGFFPEMGDYNTGPEQYLELVAGARKYLDIPVIASINGTSRGGWTRYARQLQDAGASAVELNIYMVAADVDETAAMIEVRYVDLVEAVRAAIDIPLAVKIGPQFNSPAHMARLIARSGADGLVLFNRFYQPDIDLETMEVVPRLVLSSSEEMRLPLRWIAILYGRIGASLAATTGIHTSDDVAKILLAGADVAMMTSALLKHGPEHLRIVETQLSRWMAEQGYSSVREMRGSMSQRAVDDPSVFERANYMKTLRSYPSSTW